MRIIFLECKKGFTSPILIGLIFLFAAFNMFLIFNHANRAEEMKVVNQIIDTYGSQITQQSLSQLKKESSKLEEMYVNLAESIDGLYAQIDWNKVAESEIRKYQLSGTAAQILRNEYRDFSQRFAEMMRNGEHKEWFLPGQPYMMHSFLFRTLFGYLIFESLILIVLGTALITNFEFENKTHFVTYATKRGRKIMKDKLGASMIISSAITAFLCTITLVTYFFVFDYSQLWESSISSAFNWEYKLPYVTWWNMSFLSYLIWAIVLLYGCLLLFSALTFVISVFVKNSYFTFFLFAVFFVIGFMLPGFMPTSSGLLFIAAYNLSALVMNPHIFFMGSGSITMFKNYEAMTMGVWTIITGVLCFFSLIKFNRQEIH